MRQFYVYILAKHRHGALYVGISSGDSMSIVRA